VGPKQRRNHPRKREVAVMSKAPPSLDLLTIEKQKLDELRDISWTSDSADLQKMYEAAAKLQSCDIGGSLLAKAMSLLDSKDQFVKKIAYRMSIRNVYGYYIPDFFIKIEEINPAEREQLFMNLEERFEYIGPPVTETEQKRWVDSLEKLGREHHPTVFGLMKYLGSIGTRWVTKRIRDNVKSLSLGAIQKISTYPEKTRKKMIKLLCEKAREEKRDLLPYIAGIIDTSTTRYLAPFLRSDDWQERAEVAKAVARAGITRASGMVMQIISDTDWRVKQAVADNVNFVTSKFSSITKILSYLVADSHTRVRHSAEKALLQLGSIPCIGSDIQKQRNKLLKQFRTQLLRAARVNKDVDSSWLGLDAAEEEPIPYIPETGEAVGTEEPIGVSLADISTQKVKEEEPAKSSLDLMAALLSKKEGSSSETKPKETVSKEEGEFSSDMTITEQFLWILKHESEESGKKVRLSRLRKIAKAYGFTKKKFNDALTQLEKEGVVYRSGKGTISYVDMDL
jgi:hypothetical protein